jgi:protein-tyrosine phosphatase
MALLRNKVEKEGWGGTWRIESAGTWAQAGVPVLEWVVKGLAGRGISLDGHESREVTRELLADFQLILAMDSGHKEALQVEFTESAGRVFLLSEMAGYIEEVADVGRRGYRAFKDVAEQIEQMLGLGKDRLVQLSLEPTSNGQPEGDEE